MIRFKCPSCGAAMESPASLVGELEDCPACGVTCTIPSPLPGRPSDGDAPIQRPRANAVPSAKGAGKVGAAPNPFKVAGVVVVCIGVLVVAAGFFDFWNASEMHGISIQGAGNAADSRMQAGSDRHSEALRDAVEMDTPGSPREQYDAAQRAMERAGQEYDADMARAETKYERDMLRAAEKSDAASRKFDILHWIGFGVTGVGIVLIAVGGNLSGKARR